MSSITVKHSKLPVYQLGSIYMIYIFTGALALAVGSLAPYIRDSYGLSYVLTGILLSLHSVGNLVAGFVAGILPLKFGRRKSVMVLASCYSLSWLLIMTCRSSLVLMAAFFMTGVARGSAANFSNLEINLLVPGKSWAINGLHASFAAGAVISPLLVIFCASYLGSWQIMCGLLLVMGIAEIFIFYKLPMTSDTLVKKEKGSNLGFFRERQYWLSLGIMFTYLCAEQGVVSWLVTYFKESGIMSVSYAQTMASILWVLMLFGRLMTAWISSRLNESRMLIGMGIGMLAFFVLIISSTNLTVITLGIAGFGLCMAGIYPTSVALTGTVMSRYPLSWSFTLTPSSFGSIIMPTVVGAVAESTGITNGIRTIAVAVFACLIMILLNALFHKKERVEVSNN